MSRATADSSRREIKRLLRNFRSECDTAALYEALAVIETHSSLGAAFRKLADSEREHAAFWEACLKAQACPVPIAKASLHTKLLAALARSFGVRFVLPAITARELQDRRRYAGQRDAMAAGLADTEHAHARAMRALEIDAVSIAAGAAGLENNLRAAVLAATDGLTSNFCLLMGVAGGGAQRPTILLAGVAGVVAGACSMSLGEWLSLTNARELAGVQIDKELERLRPAGELAREPTSALTAAGAPTPLAHWNANPAIAASVSFVLFACGALVPLLPFFSTSHRLPSIVLALAALFALGVLTSFFNGRGPLYSGARQLGIGAAAAAVTYGAGWLFGAVS